MRYGNLEIGDVDFTNTMSGSFIVSATEKLVDVTNDIRMKKGNTDIVSVDNDNEVYYTFYLQFDIDKREIKLQAECNHGEKDDYVWYDLPLSTEEKEVILFKIIEYLVKELETEQSNISK